MLLAGWMSACSPCKRSPYRGTLDVREYYSAHPEDLRQGRAAEAKCLDPCPTHLHCGRRRLSVLASSMRESICPWGDRVCHLAPVIPHRPTRTSSQRRVITCSIVPPLTSLNRCISLAFAVKENTDWSFAGQKSTIVMFVPETSKVDENRRATSLIVPDCCNVEPSNTKMPLAESVGRFPPPLGPT